MKQLIIQLKKISILVTLILVFSPSHAIAWECPTTHQNVFIIDLKSGWWSGDGGDFGDKLIEQIINTCPEKFSIDYWHVNQYNDGEPPRPWNTIILPKL